MAYVSERRKKVSGDTVTSNTNIDNQNTTRSNVQNNTSNTPVQNNYVSKRRQAITNPQTVKIETPKQVQTTTQTQPVQVKQPYTTKLQNTMSALLPSYKPVNNTANTQTVTSQTAQTEPSNQKTLLDKIKDFATTSMGGIIKNISKNGVQVKSNEEVYKDMNPYNAALQKGTTQFVTGMNNAPRAALRAAGVNTPQLDSMAQQGDELLEAIQNQSKLKDVTGAQKFATDVITTAGNIAPSMLLGGVTGSALPFIAASAGGNAARQAENEGATPRQALAYGALSGGIEAGTEKLFGFVPFLNKTGVLDKTINKVIKPIDNGIVNALTKRSLGALGEGTEEVISGVLDPLAQKVTYNENAKPAEISDLAYQGAIGVAISSLLGLPTMVNDIYTAIDSTTAKKAQEVSKALPKKYVSTQAKPVEEMTEPEQIEFVNTVRNDVSDYATKELNNLAEQIEQEELQQTSPVSDVPVNATQPVTANNNSQIGNDNAQQQTVPTIENENIQSTPQAKGMTLKERGGYNAVSSKNVNAYMFDNPEVKPYYQEYAGYMLENEFVPNTNLDRETSVMKKLKADTGLTPKAIKDGLERLVNNDGQENTAAAKRIELVIDDMLANGFETVKGEEIPPIKEYINIRNKLEASSISGEPKQLEELPFVERNEYKTNSKPQAVQGYSVNNLTGLDTNVIPKSTSTSQNAKTVDDVVSIIENRIGVPIRTGKYNQNALGIFKIQPEVIRTKVRNDLPTISHEVGHYFDKKFNLSNNKDFDNELLKIGKRTSKNSYSKDQVRAEGIAEFMRLYLTNPAQVYTSTPDFLKYFESTVDAETVKFLGNVRADISNIVNLPVSKSIMNDVSQYEARKSNVKSIGRLQKLYNAWVDDSAPFQTLQKFAEDKGYKGDNISNKVALHRGFEAKAMNMLNDKQRNLSGEIVGDSLMTILEPVNKTAARKLKVKPKELREDFISYMISRRAMDYKDRGLVMPKPFYMYSDNITQTENKYPFFVEVFDNVRKWENNNLQLLVDSGIKTQSEIEDIKAANANHVPLYRIKEAAESIRTGAGKTLGQSKKVIKKAKGSGATIIDPLESMIVDSFIIRRAAESNSILKILDVFSELDSAGKFVERVPPGMKSTSFTVDEVKKQLKNIAEANEDVELQESIKNMDDATLENVMSIYRPLYNERDNEITVYKNGKPQLLEVDPELHKAIKGLNNQQSHWVIRLLNVPKRVIQFGAVTTVDFAIKNMVRDTVSSSIQSEAGINPLDIIAGYARTFKKRDKWINEFLAHGGGTEYINVADRTQAQSIEDDLLGYNISDKFSRLIDCIAEVKTSKNQRSVDKLKKAAKAVLFEPINFVRDIVGMSEEGPRVAEYKKAVEKGYSKDEAAVLARKLSQDFLRHGYAGKELNKMTAFFNAAVQGNARIAETFKKHPMRTLLRGGVYITLPSMLLYFINHDDEDYKQLPDWRKAMFYNIPIGDGKFFMLPKPYGYGFIFGALPEITLDKMLNDDKETWNKIKTAFDSNFDLSIIPSSVSPVIQVARNKSWTNTPIEGKYDRENKPAYKISGDKTSTLSKNISNLIKNEKGLSPKQIDYLVKGYTGTVGNTLWNLPDTVDKDKTIKDTANIPVVKSFVTDSVYSNDILNKLFDYDHELTLREKEFEDAKKYAGKDSMPDGVKALKKEIGSFTRSTLKDYNDEIDSINNNNNLTANQKYGRLREAKRKLNNKAKELNKKYENFKLKNNLK